VTSSGLSHTSVYQLNKDITGKDNILTHRGKLAEYFYDMYEVTKTYYLYYLATSYVVATTTNLLILLYE
jgi:hypothetical protein